MSATLFIADNQPNITCQSCRKEQKIMKQMYKCNFCNNKYKLKTPKESTSFCSDCNKKYINCTNCRSKSVVDIDILAIDYLCSSCPLIKCTTCKLEFIGKNDDVTTCKKCTDESFTHLLTCITCNDRFSGDVRIEKYSGNVIYCDNCSDMYEDSKKAIDYMKDIVDTSSVRPGYSVIITYNRNCTVEDSNICCGGMDHECDSSCYTIIVPLLTVITKKNISKNGFVSGYNDLFNIENERSHYETISYYFMNARVIKNYSNDIF